MERIQKDNKDVGFYLSWCKWFAQVTPVEAVNVLQRFPPDARFPVTIVGLSLFIGGEKP